MNRFILCAAALAAVVPFASCDKTDSIPSSEDSVLKIQLAYGESTYVVDSPLAAGKNTELKSAVMFELAGSMVLKCDELTPENITAMTTTGWNIENVNSSVDGVIIVGNYPASTLNELKKLATRSEVENYAFTVESQQATSSYSGAEGVKNVTLMGFGQVTASASPASDGHSLKEANVKVMPLTARIQVSGKPSISTDPSNQIKDIVYKEVYFNNFYQTNARSDLKAYKPADGDWSTVLPNWARDKYDSATEGSTKCYAYQFFPALETDAAKLPMIIIKADITLKNDSKLENYYLTIKNYSVGGQGSTLEQMVANKIYNVQLKDVKLSHSDFAPTPNPEQADLKITVTVEDWTVENIIPKI